MEGTCFGEKHKELGTKGHPLPGCTLHQPEGIRFYIAISYPRLLFLPRVRDILSSHMLERNEGLCTFGGLSCQDKTLGQVGGAVGLTFLWHPLFT